MALVNLSYKKIEAYRKRVLNMKYMSHLIAHEMHAEGK